MTTYDASEVLNRVTAPDNYTPLATIEDTPIRRILFDVVNQAIYWQLKKSATTSGAGYWESVETYMIPGSRVVSRGGVTGVRIRAAIPAIQLPAGSSQAIVTVEAVK